MSFLSPFYFWSFLALIPLLGIYFLKVRPRRKPTSALFLWQRVFEEKRRSALFRRLRDLFSLLLMALAFAAVALALTDPEIADDERLDLFLVLDHSVSMRAGGENASLERAKSKARSIIRGLRGDQRAAVVRIASELHFQTHLTNNPRALLDAVEEIEPSEHPLNLGAIAGLLAEEEASGSHRVLFLTDHVPDAKEVPSSIEVVRVSDPLENVGIVAADLQRLPDAERRLGLYFQLASSFQEPQTVDVIAKRPESGEIGKLVQVIVEPGLNAPEVYTLEQAEAGPWTLELEIADALDEDNRAWLVAQEQSPVSVAVAVADGYFFRKAVEAFEGSDSLRLVSEEADLVVSKSETPEAPLSLIFQPDGTSPWWTSLGDDVDEVVPKVLIEEHPALRFVDASSLRYTGAREIQAPEGALILVESDLGLPLIYLDRQESRSAVIVNMDPLAADFYLSAWFPVLIQSVTLALAGRDERMMASYRVGITVTLPGYERGDTVSVTLPDGSESRVEERQWGPLSQLGYYQITSGKGKLAVGASLFRAEESLLGKGRERQDERAIAGLASGSPIAWWLTIGAIFLIVIESVLYHRRKVG